MDEIGQKLRAARIEKGYTLDDLQQITKIQKRYLIAIEEGNFGALPGDFYVRAFIKQYADTVGLDSDALLTQFQQDIPDTQPQEYVDQSVENKTRATRAIENNPGIKLRRYLPQVIIVLLVLVIFGAIYWAIIQQSAGEKRAIPVQSSAVSVSSKKESKSSSSSKSSSESSKKEESSSSSKKDDELTISVAQASGSTQAVTVKNMPATGNKLKVSATGAAWVAVMVNGATTWQATLAAGESQEVDIPDNTTTFDVRSGNALGTQLELNGKTVDISSGTSVVRTITFTADSTASSSSSSSDASESTGD
ncbi:helix-turn-helix domain-containing protein [Lacticaseibacillus yichunensis]|uniref:Helix-turn-helix domain-containing protein n=1 Tax=Lacticaseibacillus yichunensis TaxID=2486015 RepID=A0ABW4CLG1_9LACO|nr:RodZ domain-containing protein [Lacticaseibacillus yichunensis]